MVRSLLLPSKQPTRSKEVAPEHPWISDRSTLNPSPGPLLKERRDTVEGCRDRATADLLASVAMTTALRRDMLETSAAAWTARADLLQRSENEDPSHPGRIYLTPGEIVDDAASVTRRGSPKTRPVHR